MKKPCQQSIILRLFGSLFFIPFLFFSCSNPSAQSPDIKRPNILLLVADDLGYADLGCYGGDIETPNIDNLSQNGIRFSRFHTSPLCSPTRAMLLSGNDNHIAGIGRQGLVTDQFGYEGRISDRVAIIPEVLKSAGYHTYMAGKWHLGVDSAANPVNRGFERSFVNLDGAGNHFDDFGMFENYPKVPLTEDGQIAQWKEGSYSTDLYTDKLIEYIGSNIEDDQPFFAFAAYTAPHWPLQVHAKYWRKYEGKYDEGYEALKEKRFESLIRAGMIPENAVLPPNHPRVIPWDSLTLHEQKKESRKMELYAGMVDNLDVNIGRLIDFLKEINELENTLIVFMADNGAAAEDFYYHDVFGPYIQEHFTDTSYQQMGTPRSFVSYGPQWAEAGSAPFRYFKSMATEGAVIAPMIISGNGVNSQNKIYNNFISLMDLAPTFYELAEATYPQRLGDREFIPLKGKSITSIFNDMNRIIHDSTSVFTVEHGERVILIKDNWKLVNEEPPFEKENFKLFNLSNDLAELRNLREREKEKFDELIKEWNKYSSEIGVQFPTPE
jgi:arylsulfatase A-like enzyme